MLYALIHRLIIQHLFDGEDLTFSHKVKREELAKLSLPVGRKIEKILFDFSIRQKGLLSYLETWLDCHHS